MLLKLDSLLAAVVVASWVAATSNAWHCMPSNSSCWPSKSAWSAFNVSVDGLLVAPKPPGHVCSNRMGSQCIIHNNMYTDAFYRSSLVGAMQAPNWECAHLDIYDCCQRPWLPCRQGAVPEYAVAANLPVHVQKAVRFGVKHNLRVVIKSTGHDFQGRSTAKGSLLIWMHNLNKIDFHAVADSEESRCAYQNVPQPYTAWSSPQAAVTVGGGTQWDDVYEEADSRDVAVVGAMSLSVGAAGGYIQGGGHSPFGPLYGLAVDNVLRAEVVTADGVRRNATPCGENSDLLWALRGGGGGTWGVVTSITYATHPLPDNLVDITTQINTKNTSVDAFVEHIVNWTDFVDRNYNGQWSGYTVFNNLENGNMSVLFKYLFSGNPAEYRAGAAPLRQFLTSNPDKYNVTLHEEKAMRTFMEWHGPYRDQTGYSLTLSSRLIPAADIHSPEKRSKIVSAMQDLVHLFPSAHLLLVGGGAVTRQDPDSKWTSVHPAWRKTLFHVAAGPTWKMSDSNRSLIDRLFQESKAGFATLRQLTPNSGAYWNEADYWEDDWPETFWGEKNYRRLKKIKEQVDPKRLFLCWNCVGGTRAEPEHMKNMTSTPSPTEMSITTTVESGESVISLSDHFRNDFSSIIIEVVYDEFSKFYFCFEKERE